MDLCWQSNVSAFFFFFLVLPVYCYQPISLQGFPGDSDGKASAYNARDPGSIPGLGRSSGEGNGNPLQYSAWKIPWMEEHGRLQSMGLQRVGHDWVTSLDFLYVPKQYESIPEDLWGLASASRIQHFFCLTWEFPGHTVRKKTHDLPYLSCLSLPVLLAIQHTLNAVQ